MNVHLLLLLFLSMHLALTLPTAKEHETVEICYDDLGCIVIDDSWYDTNRPFNLEPLSREKINTRFILKTRELPNRDTMIYANDLDSIRNSHFNPSRPTVFICHGFIDDGNVSWIRRLTAALLDYQDCNVIAVNWGGGSLPLYTQATANTRLVGLEIAHLVNTLIAEFGVDPEMVHLIGHSLGAHTVGYAGEKIANLGRITGLDPAEPYFQYMPEHVRLDPSDAKFVDVIHTDTKTILLLGYGMIQPCGHLDFYVNGGRQQPGCNLVDIGLDAITEDMVTGVRELAACNHLRACEFLIDSLRPDANMVGYECTDNDVFHLGECYTCGEDNTKCAKFGMEASLYPLRNRTFVPLYFDTGKDKPYTKYHYQVKLNLAKPSNAENQVYGQLKVSLFGNRDQLLNAPLTEDSIYLNHGNEHRMLFMNDVNVGKIQRVELHWKYDTGILHPCGLFCNDHLYVTSIEVSELSNYPESNRLDHTYKSCPVNSQYGDINSGSTAEFYPTAC